MVEKRARKRGAKCRQANGMAKRGGARKGKPTFRRTVRLKEAKVHPFGKPKYDRIHRSTSVAVVVDVDKKERPVPLTCQGHSNLAISVMANPSISKAS
jgi:hypothetical protein